MQLLRMDFSHSLHFTTPTSDSDVRGWQPKSFMSRAESHAVGGEGSEAASLIVGEGTWQSQENGEGGLLSGFSRVGLMTVVDEKRPCPPQAPMQSSPRAFLTRPRDPDTATRRAALWASKMSGW
jgi:hypothetical protein